MGGISGVVVFLELAKSFGLEVFSVLRIRWTWILLVVNAGTALIVYAISGALAGDSLGLAIGVGVGYLIILRSRFTVYRQVGAKDNPTLTTVSLKLDEAYSRLQSDCYNRIDPVLSSFRAIKAAKLANKHSEDNLRAAASRLVDGESIVENRDRHQKLLLEIAKEPKDDERKYRYAKLLIELGRDDVLQFVPRRTLPGGRP